MMSPPRSRGRETRDFKKTIETSDQLVSVFEVVSKPHGSKHGRDGETKKTGLLVCLFCRKIFAKISRLEAHLQTHTRERPHICGTCGKEFADKRWLNEHSVVHLPEERRPQFECKLYKKFYTTKKSLTQHERQHKQKELSIFHDCKLCDKQFLTLFRLEDHIQTHTGEMPFKCSYCTKSFNTTSHRRRHENIHSRSKLYTCSICQRDFTQSTSLRIHFMVHNNEAPHHCLFCDKKFRRNSDLYDHLRVHTKERPYFCNNCDFTACEPRTLTVHKKRFHEVGSYTLPHQRENTLIQNEEGRSLKENPNV